MERNLEDLNNILEFQNSWIVDRMSDLQREYEDLSWRSTINAIEYDQEWKKSSNGCLTTKLLTILQKEYGMYYYIQNECQN